MNRKANLILMVCALAALIPVLAQDEEAPVEFLSMSHEFMVKPGTELQFEEALKAHLALHKAAGDSQAWETWTQVTGKHTGLYSVRSGGLTWADLDKEPVVEGDRADVIKSIMSHVQWTSAKITQWDLEMSNWPESVGTPKMVEITVLHLNPGTERGFYHALGVVSEFLKGTDLDWKWAWGRGVSGYNGATAILAIPHENWASFKDDGTNMWKMLEEAKGRIETDLIMDEINKAIKWSENYAALYREDLSYKPAE